jgi:hypothetical protein
MGLNISSKKIYRKVFKDFIFFIVYTSNYKYGPVYGRYVHKMWIHCFIFPNLFVGLYFNRKRGIAVGLATSGVAIGAFVIPSVVEIAFVEYSYIGAFIIMTGISLQLIVCGFLFRPLALHKRITKFKKRFVLISKMVFF